MTQADATAQSHDAPTNPAGAAAPIARVQLSHHVSWQLAGQAISIGSALTVTPLLSRGLGVSGYGTYIAVMAFVGLLLSFSDLGIGATLVREVSAMRTGAGRAFTTGALMRSFNAVLMVSLGLAVAAAMHQPQQVIIGLSISSVYLLASAAMAGGPNVLFQVRGRFDLIAIAGVVQAAFWVVGAIAAVQFSGSALGVLVAMSVAAVAAAVVSWRFALKSIAEPLSFGWDTARQLLVTGVPLGVASILASLYYRADTIILSAMAGAAAVGLYGSAYRFLDQSRALASFIGLASHPVLARASTDEAEYRSAVHSVARTAGLAGGVIGALLFVLADPLSHLLFGSRFVGTAGLARILALAVVPMFMNNTISYAMIAKRHYVIYVWINLFAFLANGIANVLLIPLFGPVACAWLTAATEGSVLALSLCAIRHYLGFWPSLASPMRTWALAGLACAAFAALASNGVVVAYVAFLIILVAGLRILGLFTLGDLVALGGSSLRLVGQVAKMVGDTVLNGKRGRK